MSLITPSGFASIQLLRWHNPNLKKPCAPKYIGWINSWTIFYSRKHVVPVLVISPRNTTWYQEIISWCSRSNGIFELLLRPEHYIWHLTEPLARPGDRFREVAGYNFPARVRERPRDNFVVRGDLLADQGRLSMGAKWDKLPSIHSDGAKANQFK